MKENNKREWVACGRRVKETLISNEQDKKKKDEHLQPTSNPEHRLYNDPLIAPLEDDTMCIGHSYARCMKAFLMSSNTLKCYFQPIFTHLVSCMHIQRTLDMNTE